MLYASSEYTGILECPVLLALIIASSIESLSSRALMLTSGIMMSSARVSEKSNIRSIIFFSAVLSLLLIFHRSR